MRFIKDDVAVAHVTNEVAGVVGPAAQTQAPQREMSLRVFVRDSGDWRLTAFHNTLAARIASTIALLIVVAGRLVAACIEPMRRWLRAAPL